jgi:hypothetical protein
MKKFALILLALVSLYACKKDNSDANLHITGNIKGLKQGKLYIKRIVDTSLVTMDSIIIKGNSRFESYLKIDSPEMLYLFLDRGQTTSVDDKIPFFAEPGEMKIESNIDQFYAKAKITGSENQKIYEEFQKIKSRFTSQNMELVEKNIDAVQNKNVKQLDSITERSEQLLKKKYLVIANFAKNNAKHDVGPYLALSEIYDINVMYLDTIRKSMSPEVAKSHYGKMLTKFVEDRKKDEAAQIK